ncbi:probable tRNA [Caerostris extrusa]|uniref:tRNA (uracil-O(2)-)-methyltransferase n=1 Tax=Caerostris extrusa TaxID=172846 RepID=A0AAV4PGQ7_CAEEX|nr:probable tRNA [Caerostris extrusa]
MIQTTRGKIVKCIWIGDYPTFFHKNMDNSCILTVEAHSSPFLCPEDFSNGIKVYIERPHLINLKVLAAEPLKKLFNVNVNAEVLAILTKEDFCLNEVSDIFIKNGAVFSTSEVSKSVDNKDISKNTVIFRNLCPRKINIFKEVLEIVILDHSEGSASFFPKKSDVLKSPIAPAFPYKFTLLKMDSRCVASMQWLEKKVLPKILKWSLDIPNYPIVPSINLLSAKDYSMNLHYLKSKYAEKFLKIWNDYSNTDPKKYVYEDISIAAYISL